MTTIYFVRHCKPDGKIQDDRNRPLTEEGLEDSNKVAEILKDKKIDVFISSPYKRSHDSIKRVLGSSKHSSVFCCNCVLAGSIELQTLVPPVLPEILIA